MNKLLKKSKEDIILRQDRKIKERSGTGRSGCRDVCSRGTEVDSSVWY